MINLLPPATTKQLRASRHNTALLRYLIGMCIALGLTLLIYLATYALMRRTEVISLSSSTESKQKIQQFKDTEEKAKTYTNNLNIAKSIFNSERSYTTALHKIASALPKGSVIESLDLNPTMTGQPITLSVSATSKNVALAVKESLEKANIASNITISSFQEETPSGSSDGQTNTAPSQYPIQISLNLVFDKSLFTSGDKNV